MSIYSGFATRNQQQTYDQLIYDLIQVLSKKILKTYNHSQADQQKFRYIVKDIFMKFSLLEKQKYLQPNMSAALYQIMDYFLQFQKGNKPQFHQQKPRFWIKIQKKSQQNFTDDTHKDQQNHCQPRGITSNLKIRNKKNILNPQLTERKRKREINENYAIPIKNKFNKQKNQTLRDKQNKKKHQSLKRFQQRQIDKTFYRKQKSPKQIECPHCHCLETHKQVSRINKKYTPRKNQKTQSLNKLQVKHSRIKMPQLVKQYIQATNHNYMQHFRKRKIKFVPQFD